MFKLVNISVEINSCTKPLTYCLVPRTELNEQIYCNQLRTKSVWQQWGRFSEALLLLFH